MNSESPIEGAGEKNVIEVESVVVDVVVDDVVVFGVGSGCCTTLSKMFVEETLGGVVDGALALIGLMEYEFVTGWY